MDRPPIAAMNEPVWGVHGCLWRALCASGTATASKRPDAIDGAILKTLSRRSQTV